MQFALKHFLKFCILYLYRESLKGKAVHRFGEGNINILGSFGRTKKIRRKLAIFLGKIYGINAPILLIIGNTILATK